MLICTLIGMGVLKLHRTKYLYLSLLPKTNREENYSSLTNPNVEETNMAEKIDYQKGEIKIRCLNILKYHTRNITVL